MTTPNKVTPEQIQALVDSLTFQFERVGDTTTTACWAFLPNGFSVAHGESACVDPANFDFELGKQYAKERCLLDARNKLWELEGYVLAKELAKQPTDFIGRMRSEFDELTDRIEKLSAFLTSDKAQDLDSQELQLMLAQQEAMVSYAEALSLRLKRHG